MKTDCIKFLILMCLVVYTNHLTAQSIEERADSLQLLIEATDEDTLKAKFYIEKGTLYVYNNPSKASNFLHTGLTIAKRTAFEKGQALAFRYLFNVHDILGSHSDSLLFYIEKLEELHQKTGKIAYEVRVHWNKAIYHRNFGKVDKVIEEYLKALQLVRENNLAQSEEARLLGNIGTTFDINGDYKDALKYYEQAAPLFGADKMGTAITYFNMATIYNNQYSQTDTAIGLLNKAEIISDEYQDFSLKIDILTRKADIYDNKGQYERASQLYEKALDLANQNNLGESLLLIYSAYSEHFYKKKAYEAAIRYSKKAIELSEEKEDIRLLKPLYTLQDKAYSALGDYKNAYKAKSQLMIHLDSLRNSELQGKVKELQTQYEVQQKDAENELLKMSLQSRQYYSFALIFALILAIALGIWTYQSSQQRKRYNTILEQKVTERTKDLEQANYELRTFNYIASHDIKEPIRNIGGHVGLIKRKLPEDLRENLGTYFDTVNNSTKQLYTLIEDFAHYTNMSKHEEIQRQEVDLNELIHNVTDTLQGSIQKYNGQVLTENLPTIQTNNSFLFIIMKNLIENGLKFNEADQPTVKIEYHTTQNHHEITISDNGIGISEAYFEKVFEMFKKLHNKSEYEGSGIGLAIVKLGIEKLDGHLKLESEEREGSRFTIQLPKK